MQPVVCLTSDCLRMFDKIDYVQKVETILKKSHAMFRQILTIKSSRIKCIVVEKVKFHQDDHKHINCLSRNKF